MKKILLRLKSNSTKWQKMLNIGLKVLLLALVVHASFNLEMDQFQNKGMPYRLIAYPIGIFGVYFLTKIKAIKSKDYPYFQDLIVSFIITSDMLGNSLGLYGDVEWWDDFMHLMNSSLISLFLTKYLVDKQKTFKLSQILYAIAVTTWIQVIWELAEYVTFITTNSCEYATAYRDTIGDLLFGQIGAILGSLMFIKIYKNVLKK